MSEEGKDQLLEMLNLVASKANQVDTIKKMVEDWVGPYHGKILQIEIPGYTCHVIVSRKGMRVKEGPYPSPDVIYRASGETLVGIFTGQIAPFTLPIKTWETSDNETYNPRPDEMIVIGAAHESGPLAMIMLEVLMSM